MRAREISTRAVEAREKRSKTQKSLQRGSQTPLYLERNVPGSPQECLCRTRANVCRPCPPAPIQLRYMGIPSH